MLHRSTVEAQANDATECEGGNARPGGVRVHRIRDGRLGRGGDWRDGDDQRSRTAGLQRPRDPDAGTEVRGRRLRRRDRRQHAQDARGDRLHRRRRGDDRRSQLAIDSAWTSYTQHQLSADEKALAATAESTVKRANAAIEKLMAILARNDSAALVVFAEQELYPAIDPVSDALSKLIDVQVKVAAAEFADGGVHLHDVPPGGHHRNAPPLPDRVRHRALDRPLPLPRHRRTRGPAGIAAQRADSPPAPGCRGDGRW
ncbi:MAG: MCP four helix bundle domain-containing protein [Gemmatimonadetes bacterium]|nr:MCP four helix bundle domain-containing protein [Gemmatimonadota bacterium]